MEVESNFEMYLERYCVKHELTKEEAMKHALVREVEKYYYIRGEERCEH